MSEIMEIELAQLTGEAFAPFGQAVGELPAPPVFKVPHAEVWQMDFSSEGPVELMFVRYRKQPFEFSQMERHFNVAQTFLPLGDYPSIMVVAAPDNENRENIPEPHGLHAFYVDGKTAIVLWKGTWHALTRFPVSDEGGEYAMITGRTTQRELEAEIKGGPTAKLTEVVDYEERFGVRFKIVDPDQLLL